MKNEYKFYFYLLIGFITVVLLVSSSKSDHPVHCIKEQMEGNWVFHISETIFNPSLKDPRTSCGNGFPSQLSKENNDLIKPFPKENLFEIKLGKDYKTYDFRNNVKGKWTPVFDQGFHAFYENKEFYVNMKYFKNPKTNKYESNCSKTMYGWMIKDIKNKKENWACFYGIKTETFNSNGSNTFSQTNFLSFVQKNAKKAYLPNDDKDNNDLAKIIENKFPKMNLENLIYEKQDDVIKYINSLNLSWKAGVNTNFKGYNLKDMNDYMGESKHTDEFFRNRVLQINKIKGNLLSDSNENSSNNNRDQINEEVNKKDFNNTADKADTNNNDEDNEEDDSLFLEKNSFYEKNKFKHKLKNRNKNRRAGSKTVIKNKTNSVNKNRNSNKNTISSNNSKTSNNKINPSEVIKSISQVTNNLSEGILSKNVREKDSSFASQDQVNKYVDYDIEDIDVNTLAKNWDWSNVNGVNFLSTSSRNQGSCGSCYIFSTVGCLESRLRISTNMKDTTEFSRQFPVSCNFYTEGCKGGYPYLVAKFFNEFELVPDECFPYVASNDSCSNVCDYTKYKKKYTVSKYEYLGGFYGNTTEEDMVKEIRARGPIPGHILIHWTFGYYQGGVYSVSDLKRHIDTKPNRVTMLDNSMSWENISHGIMIVGYGEENGVKYWKCKNSWGENWGEKGYFRIQRGTDECGMESMGDAFRIHVEDRN